MCFESASVSCVVNVFAIVGVNSTQCTIVHFFMGAEFETRISETYPVICHVCKFVCFHVFTYFN